MLMPGILAADFHRGKCGLVWENRALASGMSLTEIKAAVRGLTPAELVDIEHLVVELRHAGKTELRVGEAQPGDTDVPAAMDAVFDKHRELLRRLAQ